MEYLNRKEEHYLCIIYILTIVFYFTRGALIKLLRHKRYVSKGYKRGEGEHAP